MKAIIVDDEPIMLKSFLRLSRNIQELESIYAFGSALEALEFSEKESLDIAFIDVKLPEMDGIELAAKMQEKNPCLVTIFVSALDQEDVEYEKAAVDGHITKPFSEESIREEMKRAVDRWLRRRIHVL